MLSSLDVPLNSSAVRTPCSPRTKPSTCVWLHATFKGRPWYPPTVPTSPYFSLPRAQRAAGQEACGRGAWPPAWPSSAPRTLMCLRAVTRAARGGRPRLLFPPPAARPVGSPRATSGPVPLSPLRSRTLRGGAQGTRLVSVSGAGGPVFLPPASLLHRSPRSASQQPERSTCEEVGAVAARERHGGDHEDRRTGPIRSALTGAGTHRRVGLCPREGSSGRRPGAGPMVWVRRRGLGRAVPGTG